MKEKIREILTIKRGVVYGDFPGLITDLEHLVNQEVERRIAEMMPSEEWNYCPYCGMDWVKDSEAFGCWCCGKYRSRLTNPGDSQKTEGGEG